MHPVIAGRWSARSLDPAAEVTRAELLAVIEAARVAASWGGTFPVRFLAGLRGDTTHAALAALLTRGNLRWAPAAGALVLCAVATSNAKGDLPYAMFDAGLATAQLSLQAVAQGLIAHPMSGFDRAGARQAFDIPDSVEPVVLIALGHLAAERTNERDLEPRRRPALREVLFGEAWGQEF